MDKSLAIRIDAKLHKLVKMRTLENKMTLKDYIIGLIINDLGERKPLTFENISADSIISEESVKEAQKVLDFVSSLLKAQKEND